MVFLFIPTVQRMSEDSSVFLKKKKERKMEGANVKKG